MVRPKTIDGTRFIKIRVTNTFYEFIRKKSKELGIPSMSEFCRSALEIVCMGMYIGKDVKMGEIEKKFWEKYGRGKSGIGKSEKKVS